jgi:hypothetical protein
VAFEKGACGRPAMRGHGSVLTMAQQAKQFARKAFEFQGDLVKIWLLGYALDLRTDFRD